MNAVHVTTVVELSYLKKERVSSILPIHVDEALKGDCVVPYQILGTCVA